MDLAPHAFVPYEWKHTPSEIGHASGSSGTRTNSDAAVIDIERDFLIDLGASPDQIHRLENDAARARVSLVQAAVAQGAIRASDLTARLSRSLELSEPAAGEATRLPEAPDEAWRLFDTPVRLSARAGRMIAVNGETYSPTALAALARRLGAKRERVMLMTRQELIDAVTRSHGSAMVETAVRGLLMARPDWSAKVGLAVWQLYFATVAVGLVLGAVAFAPAETLTLASAMLSIFFLLTIALRAAAAINIALPRPKPKEARLLGDAELPRYTVLVPLYRETAILPHLAHALASLDYPAAKLDIKIVLEASDRDTIEAAQKLAFPGNVDLVVVPDREPRTKPKALNYALHFASGEFVVIYDAEDRPEPDQLRKAATVFAQAPADLVCLQARLDYYNARENWLSRQFTIEYATLFRGLLPLLARFRLPLPLGGTSNHFRAAALREIGAWDPYNVTEDADLGMRLARAGYRTGTLESTTWEEACCRPMPWLKQRTRWLKGWMQTFGVHMRRPREAMSELGVAGFLSFHAYFAGIIVSALAHPVFYILMLYEVLQGRLFAGEGAMENLLLWIAAVNFVGGYAANIALSAFAVAGTRHRHLMLHVLFIPVYWLFVSAAAYRALWQLFHAPFHWEKTEHGVSRLARPFPA
ncbi:glycosyltransferase [Rhodomicrobium udaipurense]|uniref:Glycosyltransferase n=1 Tax=Rhodomicrobium udaipurense TaxID=1202716 RepID=A0A8I1GDK6_9HYPH|nr:glycosyltransferase [Rhodomicrobium udaipurense]MBJ7542924.1 glycosyltransferase [Rhodomicrobium udaipurense]